MEFYFCDANLVIFWGKIKKYQGVFADSRRGGDEKKDGPCEPSDRDLIITTICYNSQLSILFRFHSN